MEEKVTVIVAIYNGEKYIKRCVNSIIKQTYKYLEILLINDGSTDDSLNIMKEYQLKDDRIILINKQNTGVSDTRNIGIDKATGKYMVFIDVDDWIENEMIEKMINIHNSKNVDVIRCNYYINYDTGFQEKNIYNKLMTNKCIEKKEITEKVIPQIVSGNLPGFVWVLFIPTEIVRNIGKFNSNLAMMEDTIFTIELLTSIKSIYILDDCLYHYNIVLNSASHSVNNCMRNFKDILLVNKIEKKYLISKNIANDEIIKLCDTSHAIMIEEICYKLYFELTNDKFEKRIDEILNQDNVLKILENSYLNNLKFHVKISLILLKNKDVKKMKIFFKIRKFFSKIKSKLTNKKYFNESE